MNLFDATKIGSLELKNRFVRSATWRNLADKNNNITESYFKEYENLAKGGVALIFTDAMFTHDHKGLHGFINSSRKTILFQ